MVFNVGATVLYITAFITCSASVEPTSLKGSRPYNQRAAASVSMVPWGTLVSDRADRSKRGLCPWTPTASGSQARHLPQAQSPSSSQWTHRCPCCCLVTKSGPILCDPMDHRPPGSCPWDFPGSNTGLGCHFLPWVSSRSRG